MRYWKIEPGGGRDLKTWQQWVEDESEAQVRGARFLLLAG